MLASILQKAGIKPGRSLHLSIPKLLMAATVAGGAVSLFGAGSARANVYASSCAFTTFADCTGPTGAGWAFVGLPLPPVSSNPLQLGDKLLEITAYDFNKWNGSAFVKAPGVFEFTWNEGSLATFNDDAWTLRTRFNLPGVGGNNTDALGSLNYTMAIVGSSATFKDARLDTATNSGFVSVTKAIAGFGSATAVNNTGSVPPSVPLSGTFVQVTDTYTVGTNGILNSFNNTFTQTDTVPGPLPLLGAGMALGFSRKLRSRIKGSAKA
jgi:hypothetical protein